MGIKNFSQHCKAEEERVTQKHRETDSPRKTEGQIKITTYILERIFGSVSFKTADFTM